MIFDSKTEEVAEAWEKLYNEHHNLYSSPINYMVLNQEGLNARCLSNAWERKCIPTGFWLGSLKGEGNLEDLDVNVCSVHVIQNKEKRLILMKKSNVTSRLIKWVYFLNK